VREPSGKLPIAKKSLGQNFLTDPNYIRKIIGAVAPSATDTIVEIGPGRGALTGELVGSGAYVVAIELDSKLGPLLVERFGSKRFQLIEADVLKFDFRSLMDFGGTKTKLVANLPYYISTAILQRLAEHRDLLSEMVLMFQKEVVDRITAPPGKSERGFLTVIVEAAFGIEKLFDVPPTAFLPRPKVRSSVVRLMPKAKSEYDDESFVKLVSAAFAQKRKTLLNNLKRTFPDAGRVIERAGVDPDRRAETLTPEEWVELHRALVQS
jgi:16S rRNA (adenine1518-N6/adenine1519-N6)-dimethyltransferase